MVRGSGGRAGQYERHGGGDRADQWPDVGHGEPETGALERRAALFDHQAIGGTAALSEGLITKDTKSPWAAAAGSISPPPWPTPTTPILKPWAAS